MYVFIYLTKVWIHCLHLPSSKISHKINNRPDPFSLSPLYCLSQWCILALVDGSIIMHTLSKRDPCCLSNILLIHDYPGVICCAYGSVILNRIWPSTKNSFLHVNVICSRVVWLIEGVGTELFSFILLATFTSAWLDYISVHLWQWCCRLVYNYQSIVDTIDQLS